MTMFTHETLVWLSKSYGLIYLVMMFIVVVAYAYWPSNQERFDRAGESVLRDEDRPWR